MSRLPQPRARDMLEAGVIVALGSDFNPNAYCLSMVSTTGLVCKMVRPLYLLPLFVLSL